jgi:hypothetical protein
MKLTRKVLIEKFKLIKLEFKLLGTTVLTIEPKINSDITPYIEKINGEYFVNYFSS